MLRSMVGNIAIDGEPTSKEMALFIDATMTATGRGSFKSTSDDTGVKLANTVLLSTRWMISRLKMATLQPLWQKGDGYKGTFKARAKILNEVYVKTLMSRYVYLTAISLILQSIGGDDEDELVFNPLDSRFWKLSYKGTTVDLLSGMRQYVNLLSRVAAGEKVNAKGLLVPLRGEGSSRFTGGVKSELTDFVMSRLNVNLAFSLELLEGKFYGDVPSLP